MAKAPQISTKRVAIDKTSAQIVAAVAVACFVTIFSLFAIKAAFSTNRYQAKVSTAKQAALTQLTTNLSNYDQLQKSYASFDKSDPNVIGGSRTGTGDKDGSNSQIVLDALPNRYDFPALASSVEKILNDQGVNLTTISGTDDQVNQETNQSSDTPAPVEIPFSFAIKDANYDSVKKLFGALDQSIRPMSMDTMTVTGGGNNMTVNITAKTYYQPSKNVNIKTEVVK